MQFVDDNSMTVPSKDEAKDVPNLRLVHTRFGQTIRLERRDPHGFIYVVWYSGATPAALSGSYTDFPKARQAVEIYLNSETFNKVVDAPVERPEFKYKKVKTMEAVSA